MKSNLDRLSNAIHQIMTAIDNKSLEIKIGLNQGLRLGLSILVTILSGIFLALLSLILERSLSPGLIIILSLVIGLGTYLLLSMIKS